MTESPAMFLRLCWVAATLASFAAPAAAQNQHLPSKIGACAMTAIKEVGDRFGDPLPDLKPDPETGTLVVFANGGTQVSYQWEGEVARSRVGDKVRVCLVELPRDCPPGDTRGKVYKTTNLRTGESWTLSDSQHTCGGA